MKDLGREDSERIATDQLRAKGEVKLALAFHYVPQGT
jgi:hypothetical protein